MEPSSSSESSSASESAAESDSDFVSTFCFQSLLRPARFVLSPASCLENGESDCDWKKDAALKVVMNPNSIVMYGLIVCILNVLILTLIDLVKKDRFPS